MAPGGHHRNSRTLRSDRCYPIQAKLHYRIVRGCQIQEGLGTTLEVSSSRLVFTAEHTIPSGLKIEVWVDWPVRLDNAVALRLHICGETARTEEGYAAVRILRHEFRTSNGNRVLPAGRLFLI
jgi:hypothetical protein